GRRGAVLGAGRVGGERGGGAGAGGGRGAGGGPPPYRHGGDVPQRAERRRGARAKQHAARGDLRHDEADAAPPERIARAREEPRAATPRLRRSLPDPLAAPGVARATVVGARSAPRPR